MKDLRDFILFCFISMSIIVVVFAGTNFFYNALLHKASNVRIEKLEEKINLLLEAEGIEYEETN